MFSGGVGSTFLGFILFISGVSGRADSICALKGSSVDLPCSATQPTTNRKWYTVSLNGSRSMHELPADGTHSTTNMSEERNFALTIKDLRESDNNYYCCQQSPGKLQLCWDNRIQLHVTDLQVKVIPTKEGNTVTLMCSISCSLTETPAAYVWYKNGEFLYEDWSPWYQHLVSGDEDVTYSCAIKGYEDLKAHEVSVDAVTSTCFNLTYAGGRMCSETSVDSRCSITFPTEVNIQRTPSEKDVTLTCNTSCPLIDSQTAYTWYEGGNLNHDTDSQQRRFHHTIDKELACALKTNKDLLSAGVCLNDTDCWRVNYVNRTICALQGSTINISGEYLHPENQQPKKKTWYKITTNSDESAEGLTEAAGRVEYHNLKNQSILRIINLKRNDSAEYVFSLQRDEEGWGKPDLRGVMVTVTGLEVTFTPSAVVTEGQRVTLTCSTSCPLTDDTNYIWNFNSRPLTLPESTDKQLVLDPVSSQHAGRYSCAVKTYNISSHEKTLAVHSKTEKWILAAAAGTSAALLVIIPIVVLWLVRRKRTSGQPPTTKTSQNMQQLNHGRVNDNISARPTEQDDLHYSTVHFSNNQVDPLYSTVQPHQPNEQEHVHYAVVTHTKHKA